MIVQVELQCADLVCSRSRMCWTWQAGQATALDRLQLAALISTPYDSQYLMEQDMLRQDGLGQQFQHHSTVCYFERKLMRMMRSFNLTVDDIYLHFCSGNHLSNISLSISISIQLESLPVRPTSCVRYLLTNSVCIQLTSSAFSSAPHQSRYLSFSSYQPYS